MEQRKKKNGTKLVLIGILAISVLFGALQLNNIPLEIRPVTGEIDAPQDVVAILERSCYNCHSNKTDLSWYDKIAPISWVVNKDVERAREVMNFSEWDKISPEAHIGRMYAVLNMVKAGKMPLGNYKLLHPEAEIVESNVETIERYVHQLSEDQDKSRREEMGKQQVNDLESHRKTVLKDVPLSPNGIEYSDDFKTWQVISMSTLYDHSMRVIYGNDIAVKAIEEENFHPWPDGAVVVKAVWEQAENQYGEVRPGSFQNAQFMVKDAKKFKNTEGWGFAKFNTTALIPTGNSALFAAQSCIGCHRQLVEETGYLFNVPLKVNPTK